jgi:hypothetical protein
MNTVFRVLLAIWIVGYLAIACAPLFADSVFIGGIGFVSGILLLIPFVVGCVILVSLIWLTNNRRA